MMAGWLALMIRQELQAKPYKLHWAPLDGWFDAAAIWIPALMVVVGAISGGWIGRRSLAAVPLGTAFAAWIVAFLSFAALWWSTESLLPRAGDFGSGEIWRAMYSFLRHDGLVTVMTAASISLVLWVAREPRPAQQRSS
jgi:hypothetical protein